MKILIRESEQPDVTQQLLSEIGDDIGVSAYKLTLQPQGDYMLTTIKQEGERIVDALYNSSSYNVHEPSGNTRVVDAYAYFAKVRVIFRNDSATVRIFLFVDKYLKGVTSDNNNIEKSSYSEIYTMEEIQLARKRMPEFVDAAEMTDYIIDRGEYIYEAVYHIATVEKFTGITDSDIDKYLLSESGDYFELLLKSGQLRGFYIRGMQLKDEKTGKVMNVVNQI